MDTSLHTVGNLFKQLGLASDPAAVDGFIRSHRPLGAGTALWDAPFWTPGQAQLLRDAIASDGDWSQVVDELSLSLSR
jgi:hypothetical protein